MNAPVPEDSRSRLVALGRQIRDRVLGARSHEGPTWSRPVGRSRADIQFALDDLAERGLVEDVRRIFGEREPLRLVCEGSREEDEILVPGPGGKVLVIDPVDGTRGLMHDKRSGFCLLALVPEGGGIAAAEAACMVEIPTTRSHLSDVLVADAQGALACWTENLQSGERRQFEPAPSRARDLRHGFGTVVRYCSGAATAFGLFEDDFLRALFAGEPEATQEIYEDQFICNGGQMHALVTGRDRFVADLRPLFVTREGLPLTASHPYDLCAARIASNAGVILTDEHGDPLDAPTDTTSRIAWVGYANEDLRALVEPHLLGTLRAHELIDD